MRPSEVEVQGKPVASGFRKPISNFATAGRWILKANLKLCVFLVLIVVFCASSCALLVLLIVFVLFFFFGALF